MYITCTVPCKHFGICEIEYMFDGRNLRFEECVNVTCKRDVF